MEKYTILKKFQFISSLIEYSHDNHDAISFLHMKEKRFHYSYVSDDPTIPAVLHEGELRQEYVACLKNACCFSGSDVILLGDNHVYHEFKTIKALEGIADCSDYRVIYCDTQDACEIRIPHKKQNIHKGVFLSGIFSENYYHFVFSILSKTELLSYIPKDVPLIVDKNIEKYESYKFLLNICNRENRELIIIDTNVCYKVETLYLISTPLFLAPNILPGKVDRPECTQYDIDVLQKLRKHLLDVIPEDKTLPKRIFLSRKNASPRRPFNEYECKKILEGYGFHTIYPEELTFVQQVQLFNNAEIIVGGSGAAFTNMLFCSAGCKVLIFIGYKISLSFWQPLACMNDVKFFRLHDVNKGILTENNHPYDLHSPFNIDPDCLSEQIKAFGLTQIANRENVNQRDQDCVTISVLTYNSSMTVEETLESIRKQDYHKLLLQICDDCSTDNTIAICKDWIEKNRSRFIDVIISQAESNHGVSFTCNRSINLCETTYMKEISGDDTLEPNCISRFMEYVMSSPDHVIYFSRINFFGDNHKLVKKFQGIPYDELLAKSPSEQLHYLIYEGNCLPAASAFYNVDKLRTMKLRNDESIPHMEDWPKWINYLKKGGTFGFVDEPLVRYRVGNGISTSNVFQNKYRHSIIKFSILYRLPYILQKDDREINIFIDKLCNMMNNSTAEANIIFKKNQKHLRAIRGLLYFASSLLLIIIYLLYITITR